MRRCTGFNPSRTSGNARDTMTLIEYSRNAASTSSTSVRDGTSDGASRVSCADPRDPRAAGFFRAAMAISYRRVLDIEEAGVLGVVLDPGTARLHVVAH